MINKVNIFNSPSGLAIAVGCMFLCLYGFWFYSLPFFLLAILLVSRQQIKISYQFLFFISSILLMIILSELIGVPSISFVDDSYFEAHRFNIFERYRTTEAMYFYSLTKLIIMIPIFLLLGRISSQMIVHNSLRIILITFCSIILFQWFFFHGTGTKLDFALGSVESRDILNNIYRPTGLFFEPVSAAISIYLITLYCLFISRKDWKLVLLVLFTMAVIKSSAGFIFAIVISYIFFFKKDSTDMKSKIFFMALVLIILYLNMEFLLERFITNRDLSLVYRLTSLNLFFTDFDIFRRLLGSGIAYNDCGCLLYDTPIIWYLFYLSGLVWLFYLLIFIRVLTAKSRLFLLATLIIPYTVFQPVIWFFIGAFIQFKSEQTER